MIYRRLENFYATIPYRDIYARLGKKSGSYLNESIDENFQKWIREAFLLCEVKAAYTVFKIDNVQVDFVEFNETKIYSKSLSKFLIDCQFVVLMGITVGKQIVEVRDSLMETNPAKAIVFDATASETTDNALDTLQKTISVMYSRNMGSLLNARFSPGYGDLSIEVQKYLYDALRLDDIGIEIGDNFFMQPEKSATAFSGFKRE